MWCGLWPASGLVLSGFLCTRCSEGVTAPSFLSDLWAGLGSAGLVVLLTAAGGLCSLCVLLPWYSEPRVGKEVLPVRQRKGTHFAMASCNVQPLGMSFYYQDLNLNYHQDGDNMMSNTKTA